MKEVNKQSSPTGISRREFLGMAATGAAALTILPSFTVAGLGHVAPSDKLYIAKIGCGGMGAADLGSLCISRSNGCSSDRPRGDHLSVRRG